MRRHRLKPRFLSLRRAICVSTRRNRNIAQYALELSALCTNGNHLPSHFSRIEIRFFYLPENMLYFRCHFHRDFVVIVILLSSDYNLIITHNYYYYYYCSTIIIINSTLFDNNNNYYYCSSYMS